jgi:hypothetical protein
VLLIAFNNVRQLTELPRFRSVPLRIDLSTGLYVLVKSRGEPFKELSQVLLLLNDLLLICKVVVRRHSICERHLHLLFDFLRRGRSTFLKSLCFLLLLLCTLYGLEVP